MPKRTRTGRRGKIALVKHAHYKTRHHVRIIVSVFAEKDGKFLFIEQKAQGRRLAEPVGHLEAHEGILDAAAREFCEETGYRAKIKGLVGVYHNIYSKQNLSDSVRYIFWGTIVGKAGRREAGVELHWIPRSSLRTALTVLSHPTSRRALKDFLDGQRFPLRVLREMRLEKRPAPR